MRIALQELVDYCSAKEDAEICFPFGDVPICFKYDGHIFVEIYPNDSDYKITVRCNPDIGACYREQYKDIVIPGYHVPMRQRRYKNTILLDRDLSKEIIFEMIDHSYNTLKR